MQSGTERPLLIWALLFWIPNSLRSKRFRQQMRFLLTYRLSLKPCNTEWPFSKGNPVLTELLVLLHSLKAWFKYLMITYRVLTLRSRSISSQFSPHRRNSRKPLRSFEKRHRRCHQNSLLFKTLIQASRSKLSHRFRPCFQANSWCR